LEASQCNYFEVSEPLYFGKNNLHHPQQFGLSFGLSLINSSPINLANNDYPQLVYELRYEKKKYYFEVSELLLI
jgi:hypothetical protein